MISAQQFEAIDATHPITLHHMQKGVSEKNRDTGKENKGAGLRDFVSKRLKELGITMREAERRGGLHPGFIGDLLRGAKAGLHAHNVIPMARALNVGPDVISSVLGGAGAVHGGSSAGFPNINDVSAASDSPRLPLGQTKSDETNGPVPIELTIGQELKVQALVDRAIVTAMLDLLIHARP